jgi:Outer membrane protein beta-barrel domain
MRTLLAVALIATAAPAASAGTYIGLGIGSGANVSDTVDSPYLADGRSAKLAVGFSFGRLAVEGQYSGFGLIRQNGPATGALDSRTLSAALKYNYPLGNSFEVFGRAGLLRTDLTLRDVGPMSTSGDGFLLGAGFEYRLPAFGGIFVDYTRDEATFDSSLKGAPLDQTSSMWMLGVDISL